MGEVKDAPLQPCPCGLTPLKLLITCEHERPKWAHCYGDCCNEWSIEYRNNYTPVHSDEGMALAVKAWNDSTRAPALADGRTACVRVMSEDECRAEFEKIHGKCPDDTDVVARTAWRIRIGAWIASRRAMGAVR